MGRRRVPAAPRKEPAITSTEEPRPVAPADRFGSGLAFAALSAASFGTSGTLASGLLTADWTPGLAVTLRITIGALALLPVVLWSLRGRLHLIRDNAQTLFLYGALAVALPQTCYFFAVRRLPVGPALLIEYLAPVVVLGWQWARHGQRPSRLTVAGAVAAMAGLLLVLGLTTDTPLDPIGVLWAFGACFGAVAFFLLSARIDTGLPPMALAGGGLACGGVLLWIVGAVGVLPLARGDAVTHFGDVAVPAWVTLAVLGLVSAALAYSAGIAATRRLGPRLASFVGLAEVLVAFGYAWTLLGQVPTATQALGAGLVLAGIVGVKLGEPR